MRLIAAALPLALLVGGAASAAPHCHNLKGLYTPCTAGSGQQGSFDRRAGPAKADGAAVVVRSGGDNAASERAEAATPAVQAKPRKPALFGRGRSCRDAKGMFRPC
jgi:hypothetical protein